MINDRASSPKEYYHFLFKYVLDISIWIFFLTDEFILMSLHSVWLLQGILNLFFFSLVSTGTFQCTKLVNLINKGIK